MPDKWLEEIKEKISCPQLGDDHYGEWGILTKNQRFMIKRMLDYINGQEAYINRLKAENKRLSTLAKLGSIRANDYRVMRDRALKAEAENERLFADNQKYLNVMLWGNKKHKKDCIKQIKAEAYKEFAERLKERKYLDETGWSHGEHPYIVEEDDIDDVLEKLAGD